MLRLLVGDVARIGGVLYRDGLSLPVKVAAIYLCLSAVAALLALWAPTALCFIPLLALAWPLGIALLDHFLQAGLMAQLAFLAIGIAANAAAAAVLAGVLRRLGSARRVPPPEPAHSVVTYPKPAPLPRRDVRPARARLN